MDLKKVRSKLVGSKEERAVSPVIGVILMVAITVILAAVIAAFVLDMGDEMGNSAPTTSIQTSTNSDWLPDDTAGPSGATQDQELAYISHKSGDSIEESNVRIVIRDSNGASVASLSDNDGWSDKGFTVTGTEEFSAGATYTVEADASSDNALWDETNDEPADDEFVIQVIDIPSDTTLTEDTHELPDNSA